MERNNTIYIKKGRKYIPKETYDLHGFSEGLWLLIKNPSSEEYKNMLYPIKVHDIQNVGKFSDFYKAHYDVITKRLCENYEKFTKNNNGKSFNISDLTNVVIKTLSEIK